MFQKTSDQFSTGGTTGGSAVCHSTTPKKGEEGESGKARQGEAREGQGHQLRGHQEKRQQESQVSPGVAQCGGSWGTARPAPASLLSPPRPKSDILKDPPSEANSIQSANTTAKTSETNHTSRYVGPESCAELPLCSHSTGLGRLGGGLRSWAGGRATRLVGGGA